MRGGYGGTIVASASNGTTASCTALSGGRAGRLTWVGRTLRVRWLYGRVLYRDDAATLDDLHEAVTTLEDMVPIARRVFGGAHPTTMGIEVELRDARLAAALRAREIS